MTEAEYAAHLRKHDDISQPIKPRAKAKKPKLPELSTLTLSDAGQVAEARLEAALTREGDGASHERTRGT